MMNFCKQITKATTVYIYQGDKILSKATAYINMAIQPRIALSQRVCKSLSTSTVKAIIHIINYEAVVIEKTFLVYSIVNIPTTYKLVSVNGAYKRENNNITIKLPPLPPQSITTYEIFSTLEEKGRFKSIVAIKAFCLGSNKFEILKTCVCENEI